MNKEVKKSLDILLQHFKLTTKESMLILMKMHSTLVHSQELTFNFKIYANDFKPLVLDANSTRQHC